MTEQYVDCTHCREALAVPGPDSWRTVVLFVLANLLIMSAVLFPPPVLLPAVWGCIASFAGWRFYKHNVRGWTLHAYIYKGVCHIHGGGLPKDPPDEVKFILVFILGFYLESGRGVTYRRKYGPLWSIGAWRVWRSWSWQELLLIDGHGHVLGLTSQYRSRLEAMKILLLQLERTESVYEIVMENGHLAAQRDAAGSWLVYFTEKILGAAVEAEATEAGAVNHYQAVVKQITSRTPGITAKLWLGWWNRFHGRLPAEFTAMVASTALDKASSSGYKPDDEEGGPGTTAGQQGSIN